MEKNIEGSSVSGLIHLSFMAINWTNDDWCGVVQGVLTILKESGVNPLGNGCDKTEGKKKIYQISFLEKRPVVKDIFYFLEKNGIIMERKGIFEKKFMQ